MAPLTRVFSRPFLVYTFIREELVYTTTHSPELRSHSLFVNASHTHQENSLLQSSRIRRFSDNSSWVEVEEEYIQRMGPRFPVFFFYSFHPYQPIRTVCSQIVKALRGSQSETVGLICFSFW